MKIILIIGAFIFAEMFFSKSALGSSSCIDACPEEKEDNSQNETNEEVLFSAIHSGDLSAVQAVLEKGVNIEARDEKDRTPLHVASLLGYPEVVQTLIEAGANINARDRNVYLTVLHYASVNEEIVATEVIRILLEAGADIEARDEEKYWTPLLMASFLGHPEVVQTLI